jgi:hypothetical protein
MTQKLVTLKKDYYLHLDKKARYLAHKLSRGINVTTLILDYIKELYDSAKSESYFQKDDEKFEVAYHHPISSELEFLIARVLHHYSSYKKLKWKIYLRRQVKKTAPDIRIENRRSSKTIAIIEVKAKAGWMQPFFSSERERKDMLRLKEQKSDFNPKELIKKVRKQLKKYHQTYHIARQRVFLFLPSLVSVHRKQSERQVKDYEEDFIRNSDLPRDNLILLSNNLLLDLSSNPSRKEYNPTERFKNFVSLLSEISKQL